MGQVASGAASTCRRQRTGLSRRRTWARPRRSAWYPLASLGARTGGHRSGCSWRATERDQRRRTARAAAVGAAWPTAGRSELERPRTESWRRCSSWWAASADGTDAGWWPADGASAPNGATDGTRQSRCDQPSRSAGRGSARRTTDRSAHAGRATHADGTSTVAGAVIRGRLHHADHRAGIDGGGGNR